MARLPDPSASQALLVGTAEYVTLDGLPAVENNLTDLQATLTDPAVWGLPAENCTLLRQPDTADSVLNALQRAAATATDTLVFYYAGHGLVDPGNDDELHLALPSSDIERAFRTAVPYSWVRREIQTARVRRKVVILDCCYSGRALGRWMGDGEDGLADRLEIDGTCVLTATARTRRALAEPNERFTAFTGELIAVLTDGIPGGPDVLDMDTLYRHLTIRLRAKSLPLPQRGQLDHGGNIALARNRAPSERPAPQTGKQDVAGPTGAARSGTESLPQSATWRQAITPHRKPEARGFVSPERAARRSANAAVLLVAWAALAAGLAWTQEPVWWLAVAAVAGFVSLLPVPVVAAADEFEDAAAAAVVWCISGIVALVIYILTAVSFTTSGLAVGWIAGILVFFVIVTFARFFAGFSRQTAEEERHLLKRQKDVASAMLSSRWMRELDVSYPGSELLDSLAEIPAVRFAGISKGCFPFVAVSGSRIMLLAFAHWPPGTYTRDPAAPADVRQDGKYSKKVTDELGSITAQAQEWPSRIPEAIFQVIIVVRPATSNRAGRMLLQLDETDSDRLSIVFATSDTFEDRAGSYLAEDAYTLNVSVLEKLNAYLDAS